MDPISLTLGAAPLVFQVFATCVKGYQLLSEAGGLEENYEFFRVRLKMEQCRLLDWAYVAELSEQDETLLLSKSSRSILLEILEQISRLLMRFGRLDDHLQPLVRPLLCEDNGSVNLSEANRVRASAEKISSRFPRSDRLQKKALQIMRDVRSIPTRLRWIVTDKELIEDLLARLSGFNDYLHDLLSSHQIEALMLQEIRTQYQILQLNNKLDDLRELIEAGLSATISKRTDGDGTPVSESSIRLARLAQFKALNTAINTGSALNSEFRCQMKLDYSQDVVRPAELPSSHIQLLSEPKESSEERTLASLRLSTGMTRPVWVEWHSVETEYTTSRHRVPHARTLKRFEALVALLRETRYTKQFRAPRCLGYYLREISLQQFQYGLVFENPVEFETCCLPVSLAQLLGDQTQSIPSLSLRLKLMRVIAEAIEKLHAVSWLHKGLRSQNIIFFCRQGGHVDITDPYLSGFDYSRPVIGASMSEGLPPRPLDDLYRHPSVQGGILDQKHDSGYSAEHDIYSLGVVLVEIAYWKPVYKVLGIAEPRSIKTRDASGARGKLLGASVLGYIRSYLGDTVRDIIEACITGASAFGVPRRDEGGSDLDGAKLQAMFYDVVVKRFQKIKI